MPTQPALRILIVDDEAIVRDSLESWLRGEGYRVWKAGHGLEALDIAANHPVDIALIDLKMPDMNGIEVMENIKAVKPDIICVIITAYGTVDSAVEAMKKGALDYISKPFNPDEISLLVQRLDSRLRLYRENKRLKSKLDMVSAFGCLHSRNEKMMKLLSVAGQVARSRSTVLILGESGTGKELLARAIHEESPRRNHPFVAVSCAALTESLLEDEIFGHEKGAFTDARESRKGKFELAHQGTIFLDEIGDISPKLQLDLLRVIQEKEFMRLGGDKMIRVDVRIISATNRDIETLVQEGKFRDDLFYRLNIITLTLPPLRERKEDIPGLIEFFINRNTGEMELDRRVQVTREAMKVLLDYDYPGNVRELEGAIEHAMILCRDSMVWPKDLPSRFFQQEKIETGDAGEAGCSLEAVEQIHIVRTLKENQYNIAKCSRLLGIDRSTLYAKMKRYGIQREE